MYSTVVFSKNGSFIQRPDWRFHTIENPFKGFNRNKFQPHIRSIENSEYSDTFHGTYLRRFLDRRKPESFTVNFRLSEEGQHVYDNLNPEQQEVFEEQQHQRFRDERIKPLSYIKDIGLPQVRWSWRLKYLDNIHDEWIKKLINHLTNREFDSYIDQVIQYKDSPEYDEMIRTIGYLIYMGIPDEVIAKKYRNNFRLKHIIALRNIFFDFSQAPPPTEAIANVSYLRQLVNNGVISEVDFNTFKLTNTLGELGLKARSDIQALNEIEAKLVANFTKRGVLGAVFGLEQSMRTSKDARAFVSLASTVSKLEIERDQLSFLKAREENERTKTEKMRGEINANSPANVSTDAKVLELIDTIYESSMKNAPPPVHRSIDDIHKEEGLQNAGT